MYLYTIKKSKFIAYSFDVKTHDEVIEHLQKLRAEHREAQHICYAFVCNNGQNGGMSDDGEPTGSAGKPLFNLLSLRKENNKAIFVVRYFGGTKLGSSNLLRAYLEAAKNELK